MDCTGVMLMYMEIDLNEVSFNTIPFSYILQAIQKVDFSSFQYQYLFLLKYGWET